MTVGGSGEFEMFQDPDDKRGKRGKRSPKKSSAKKAQQQRDVKKKRGEAAGFLDATDEAAAAVSANAKKDQQYLDKIEATAIRHRQGPFASKQFLAERKGVSQAALQRAQEFTKDMPSTETLSREMVAQIKADAAKIKSLYGAAAANEHLNIYMRGIPRETAKYIRERLTPSRDELVPVSAEGMAVVRERVNMLKAQGKHSEALRERMAAQGYQLSTIDKAVEYREAAEKARKPSMAERIRNSVFGGLSAFGIVQSSLAGFADALKKATDVVATFTTIAVAGGKPSAEMYTQSARALLAALPGALAAGGTITGAAITGFTGPGAVAGALSGAAAGYLTGLGIQFAAEPRLRQLESMDAALMQNTSDLVGISPGLTMQAARHSIERLQMQFDRADQAGAALEELEERRFELEKKAWERGTQMIIDGKTEHMELMDYLETIIDLLGGNASSGRKKQFGDIPGLYGMGGL